jgi:DNA-binding NarL/FixJ family response regulator
MKNPAILVVCKHPDILSTILRLIHKKEGWTAVGTASATEAEAVCTSTPVNLVLFGAGVEETEERQLRNSLPALRPEIKFVQHYGGGSGLLYAEVWQTLTDANENPH